LGRKGTEIKRCKAPKKELNFHGVKVVYTQGQSAKGKRK